MWKMVWNDLRHGFFPGLKRMLKQFAECQLYLYLLSIIPIIFELSGRDLAVYYAGTVPMVLAALLAGMYGGRINKVLYLCPLSADERRQYFIIFWAIRAGIPILVSLLSEGLLFILHLTGPLTFWLAVLTVAFFSLAEGMYGGFSERGGQGMPPEKRMPPGYTVWGAVILLLGISTMVFLAAAVGDMEKPRFNGPERVFVWILFFTHASAVLFVTIKYFPLAFRRMLYYEDMASGKSRTLP